MTIKSIFDLTFCCCGIILCESYGGMNGKLDNFGA